MKKLSIVLFAALTLVITACNANEKETLASNEDYVIDTKDGNEYIKEVKSDLIVDSYEEEKYEFGPADVACTLPKGFVASDYDGEYIPQNKNDLSSMNQFVYDTDTDLTKKSKEDYKKEIEEEFSSAYGENVVINITQYDKIMIDGRPGLWVMYNFELKGGYYETLAVILYNGTENNIITFLQAPDEKYMEQFIECAKTIHFEAHE